MTVFSSPNLSVNNIFYILLQKHKDSEFEMQKGRGPQRTLKLLLKFWEFQFMYFLTGCYLLCVLGEELLTSLSLNFLFLGGSYKFGSQYL